MIWQKNEKNEKGRKKKEKLVIKKEILEKC